MLEQKFIDFTFIKQGQRWTKNKSGQDTKSTATATHIGLEAIIFAEYAVDKDKNNYQWYAFLIRVPLEDLNLLHEDETMNMHFCRAGVP